MRWQVDGTDAITGQPLTLGIDEPEAVQAVHSALAKKILVKRIIPTRPLSRVYFVAAFVLIFFLSAASVYLYRSQQTALGRLHDTLELQSQLTHALGKTDEALRSLSAHLITGPDATLPPAVPIDSPQSLLDELTASQSRIAQLEKQISQQPSTPSPDPTINALRQQLAETEHRAADMETQLRTQSVHSQADLSRAAAANHALAQQIDALKAELLTAAAVSTGNESEKDASPQRQVVTRWALPTRFADAADFLNIHFDKDTVRYSPSGDDNVLGTGVLAANADTLRLLFDHDKERLYSATLTVSLAPDAPPQQMRENLDLVANYLKTFAPSFKETDTWTAGTLQELIGKTPNQRLMFVANEYLITAWNENPSSGLVSFKIEPSGPALAQ